MNCKFVKVFSFLVVWASLFISGGVASAANTGNPSQVDSFVKFSEEVDAAVTMGDNELLASLVAKSISNNPQMIKKFLAYVIAKAPKAAALIISAVQSTAPGQVENVLALVTEELAKNGGDAEIAQILEQFVPASGGNAVVPVVGRQNVPTAVRENPNQTSAN